MTTIDTLTVNIDANVQPIEQKLVELASHANAFSGAISRAFRDAVVGGKSFESVLSSLILRLSNIALDKALQPLSNLIGGLIGNLFGGFAFGQGGGHGQASAVAQGGVVAAPAVFPLARSLGLMGGAGSAAVAPAARGGDGAAGVPMMGTGAPVVVNFHITTADADSFRKSETQVTAMLARAVGRGRRGL